MQGRPALIVCLVHRGTLLHQEAHHLQVLIDTGLGARANCQLSPAPNVTHPARQDSNRDYETHRRDQSP